MHKICKPTPNDTPKPAQYRSILVRKYQVRNRKDQISKISKIIYTCCGALYPIGARKTSLSRGISTVASSFLVNLLVTPPSHLDTIPIQTTIERKYLQVLEYLVFSIALSPPFSSSSLRFRIVSGQEELEEEEEGFKYGERKRV